MWTIEWVSLFKSFFWKLFRLSVVTGIPLHLIFPAGSLVNCIVFFLIKTEHEFSEYFDGTSIIENYPFSFDRKFVGGFSVKKISFILSKTFFAFIHWEMYCLCSFGFKINWFFWIDLVKEWKGRNFVFNEWWNEAFVGWQLKIFLNFIVNAWHCKRLTL